MHQKGDQLVEVQKITSISLQQCICAGRTEFIRAPEAGRFVRLLAQGGCKCRAETTVVALLVDVFIAATRIVLGGIIIIYEKRLMV